MSTGNEPCNGKSRQAPLLNFEENDEGGRRL